MNTQLKPAEAKHLSIQEYNRFFEWWETRCGPRGDDPRDIALEAYIHAVEPIPYAARLHGEGE